MVTTKLKYMVWEPETAEEDEGTLIDALSAEYAAEEWAQQSDAEGDYCIIQGSSAICMVKPVGDGHTGRGAYEIKYFRVSGETVNRYTANEV